MPANAKSFYVMPLFRPLAHPVSFSVSSTATSVLTSAITSRLVPAITSALLSCLPQASLAEQLEKNDHEFLGWYLRYADDSGGVFDPLDLDDANWLEQAEDTPEPASTTRETSPRHTAPRNKEVAKP